MNIQQENGTLTTEQEVVRRYAIQIREAACGGVRRAPGGERRRCYELLNDCAMELAQIARQAAHRDEQRSQ